MDQLVHYRQAIKDAVTQSNEYRHSASDEGEKTIFICDEKEDCYLLMRVGWRDKLRLRKVDFFARIKDGKIWIEEDWTEDGFTDELVAVGVPREDIVLAFHPPHLRQYTEYAAD